MLNTGRLKQYQVIATQVFAGGELLYTPTWVSALISQVKLGIYAIQAYTRFTNTAGVRSLLSMECNFNYTSGGEINERPMNETLVFGGGVAAHNGGVIQYAFSAGDTFKVLPTPIIVEKRQQISFNAGIFLPAAAVAAESAYASVTIFYTEIFD